jgi:hypothetical protein
MSFPPWQVDNIHLLSGRSSLGGCDFSEVQHLRAAAASSFEFAIVLPGGQTFHGQIHQIQNICYHLSTLSAMHSSSSFLDIETRTHL